MGKDCEFVVRSIFPRRPYTTYNTRVRDACQIEPLGSARLLNLSTSILPCPVKPGVSAGQTIYGGYRGLV